MMRIGEQTVATYEWRLRKIPKETMRAIKGWALDEDISMNALLIDILDRAVAEHAQAR